MLAINLYELNGNCIKKYLNITFKKRYLISNIKYMESNRKYMRN